MATTGGRKLRGDALVERYSSEFHVGKLLVACVAAFAICGVATWVAIHFLWHPY